MNLPKEPSTPIWGNTTKLIVTFTLVAISGVLVWRFQFVLGPLLFAFILAYLLHPIAVGMSRRLHLPWRVAASILYLFIFLFLIGLITLGGFSLVQPLLSLTSFLQKLVEDFPAFIASLSKETVMIGSFSLDLSKLNLGNLWTQLQGLISPLLAKLGTLLTDIASGAASTVTWTIFTLLISYFITVESSGVRSNLIRFQVPRYQTDIERMGKQLSQIWNAFLRGQLIIFTITVTIYSLMLAVLGVRYFFALALLAGLARFVPYVGPFVAWTTYALVAFFQGTTIFGLLPFPYALIIVGCAMLTDTIIDNFVGTRVMSNALKVHPAAVLITVIIAANLIGLVGVLLAAPVLASLKLFLTYITRKLMDLDPWETLIVTAAPESLGMIVKRWYNHLRNMLVRIFQFFSKGFHWFIKLFQKENKSH